MRTFSTGIAVGVLVRRPGRGELLLGLRKGSDGAGTWCTPGGWLEPNETPVDAAARELREEIGLQGHWPIRMLDFWTFAPATDTGPAVLLLWAVVDLPVDVEATLMEPDKCVEWRWFKTGAWPTPLSRGTQTLLDKIGAGSEAWLLDVEGEDCPDSGPLSEDG